MKGLFCLAFIPFLCASAFALPTVTNVSYAQEDDGEVVVSYTLAGAPAIITADFLTNGVSIGDSHFTTLYGDVNCKVEKNGTHSFRWLPFRDMPELEINETICKASVTAWTETDPPDVIVINLLFNAERKVSYYSSIEALPGGLLDNVAYRTYNLVLKKCHTKGRSFRVGTPTGTVGLDGDNNDDHFVSFSYDYYMGVFELTQGQANTIARSRLDSRHNRHHAGLRPLTYCSIGNIRESTASDRSNSNESYAYPHSPNPGSIVGKIYAHCGLRVELPSESQWEVACHADCEYGWYGLGAVVDSDRDANAELIGRNKYNGGLNPNDFSTDFNDETSMTNQGTSVAGQYLPNRWGFYDMLGNVYELTLEIKQGNKTSNVHPADGEPYLTTTATGNNRAFAIKGSSLYRGTCGNGPGRHGGGGAVGNNQNIGARLFYRVDQASKYSDL